MLPSAHASTSCLSLSFFDEDFHVVAPQVEKPQPQSQKHASRRRAAAARKRGATATMQKMPERETGESTPPKGGTGKNPHLANMAMLPDSRTQSYEELYGPPENLLEIEVCLVCCDSR